MKTDRRLLREVLILLSLYLVPTLAVPFGAVQAIADLGTLTVTTIRGVAFSLLVIYLADLRGERSAIVPSDGGWIKRLSTTVIVACALLLMAGVIGALATFLPLPDPGVGSIIERLDSRFPRLAWIPSLVLTMASIGLVEELFFRSYLLHRFLQLGLSGSKSVLIAALLFSIGHAYQGAGALLFALFAGIFLGYLWRRRPSLFAFAAGHTLYNLSAILISHSVHATF